MGFDTSTPQPVAAAPVAGTDDTAKARPIVNLDYVFDDPSEGEPGRDRLTVHGIWEVVLLLASAVAAFLLFREDGAAFSGAQWQQLLLAASVLGFVTAASALCLRAAAPNLALGTVAVAAAVYFSANSGGALLKPMLVVIGLSAVVGLIQAAAIVGPHVPAWAASLGVAMLLFTWINRQGSVGPAGGYDPAPHAYLWFIAFVVISVTAGAILAAPSLRRGLARFRPVADPAERRGHVAAWIVVAVTVAASMLAGLAGVLVASAGRDATPRAGIELTALALGAALLGGTSVYGRRGGVFGTVLAVSLLCVMDQYAIELGRPWPTPLLAATAIGAGLLVTRLIEKYGRPRPPQAEDSEDELDSWIPKVHNPFAGRSWSTTPSGAQRSIWSSDQ